MPSETIETARTGLGVSNLFRWGSQAVAVAGWGKSLLTQPHVTIVVAGITYCVALWVATDTSKVQRRTTALWVATLAVLVCIVASGNEALVAYAPLVPIVALARGLRPAFAVVLAVTICAWATGIYVGEQLVSMVQYSAAVLGAGVFLVEFSRLLLREREDAKVIARQSALIADLSADAERQRVAQQIHDGIGHYLSSAIVQLEVVMQGRGAEPHANVTRARELVADGMAEVRNAVVALRKHSPSSFEGALEELVEASEEAGVAVQRTTRGQARRLRPEVAWALYSTLQEALTNVRKHAQARGVDIVLDYADDAVGLTVTDDGVGCSDIERGSGLRGIEERAAELGGTARFEASPGGGFSLSLRIAG